MEFLGKAGIISLQADQNKYYLQKCYKMFSVKDTFRLKDNVINRNFKFPYSGIILTKELFKHFSAL